jgi:predicted ribosomally synthesized peptide with SipW-like signal peptide
MRKIRKILISLAIIGVVAGITAGVTVSYFSDTETSTGNTFTAGSLDLKIDNKSYVNGEPEYSTTWTLRDITDELFFNFSDLKPGDWGENTVSLHVFGNKAWACFQTQITDTSENLCVEPEIESGDTTCQDQEGELQNELKFIFWADDGDNVLEEDENIFFGPISLANLDGQILTLADSTRNVWNGNSPIDSNDYFIGIAWCFGSLSLSPLPQDGSGVSGPDKRGPGIVCDGTLGTNLTQSDSVKGNISFFGIQHRNNQDFVCSDLETGG